VQTFRNGRLAALAVLSALTLALVPGATPAAAQVNVVTPNWPALTITPSGGSPVTISANGLMTTHPSGFNDYTGANFPLPPHRAGVYA